MSTFRGQEGTCEVMEELVGDWAAPEVLVGDRDLWCGTGPHCMFGWGLGPPEHPVGDWAPSKHSISIKIPLSLAF